VGASRRIVEDTTLAECGTAFDDCAEFEGGSAAGVAGTVRTIPDATLGTLFVPLGFFARLLSAVAILGRLLAETLGASRRSASGDS
jgi:hypothetical protein